MKPNHTNPKKRASTGKLTKPVGITLSIEHYYTLEMMIQRDPTDRSKLLKLALNDWLIKLAKEGDKIAIKWVKDQAKLGEEWAISLLEKITPKP